jgi:hypothetical protein
MNRISYMSIVLLLLLFLLSACAHSIPLQGRLEQTPIVTGLHLAVGVYYSDEFRNYEFRGSRMGDQWVFSLGPASAKIFDQTLPILFSSIQPVKNTLLLPGSDLAAVIEPRIEGFDIELPLLKTGHYRAEITYRFTLYSQDGVPVASWVVKGIGDKQGQVGFEFARWPGEAADLAMQDAARNLIVNIRDVPEVRRWLNQQKGL